MSIIASTNTRSVTDKTDDEILAIANPLSESIEFIGTIRRGVHVTVLYRQRSTKKDGEWLGRLVLGYEDEDIKVFGASIF